MPINTQQAFATSSAQAAALGDLLNDGYLRLYTGAQPANADTALGAQVLLAELRFALVAFGAPVNGVITAAPLTPEDAALATGTATWYRCFASDGTTAVMDGSVGLSASNLVMLDNDIVMGAPVIINNFVHTVPRS
jgi:hypothetical protein